MEEVKLTEVCEQAKKILVIVLESSQPCYEKFDFLEFRRENENLRLTQNDFWKYCLEIFEREKGKGSGF